MASHQGHAWRFVRHPVARAARLLHAAGADHQHAVGPQVDRRRDGRALAHGAVAKPFVHALQVQRLRREDEGDRRRGHQVASVSCVRTAMRCSRSQGSMAWCV